MGYVIEYDYDYKRGRNYDYNYDYDYLKKCNRLQSNTIAITITPALFAVRGILWYFSVPNLGKIFQIVLYQSNLFFLGALTCI